MEIPLRIRRRYSTIEGHYFSVLSRNVYLVRDYSKEAFVKHICNGIALGYVLNNQDIVGHDEYYNHFLPIFIEMYRNRIEHAWEDLIRR
jgi:hypothetical protein